jgi:hypothetical protein
VGLESDFAATFLAGFGAAFLFCLGAAFAFALTALAAGFAAGLVAGRALLAGFLAAARAGLALLLADVLDTGLRVIKTGLPIRNPGLRGPVEHNPGLSGPVEKADHHSQQKFWTKPDTENKDFINNTKAAQGHPETGHHAGNSCQTASEIQPRADPVQMDSSERVKMFQKQGYRPGCVNPWERNRL